MNNTKRVPHKPVQLRHLTTIADPALLQRKDLPVRALVIWAAERARWLGTEYAIDFLRRAVHYLGPRLLSMAEDGSAADRQESEWLMQELEYAQTTLQNLQRKERRARASDEQPLPSHRIGPHGKPEPLTPSQRDRRGPWWQQVVKPPWKSSHSGSGAPDRNAWPPILE